MTGGIGTMLFCFVLAFALVPILAVWHWIQWLRRRRNLPPYIRSLRRAQDGAFLLGLCYYASAWFPEFLGQTLGELVNAFLRTPRDPPVAFVVFAAFVVLALAQLIAGVVGARRAGDRDLLSAICSLLVAGGCFYLKEWHWYLPRTSPDSWLANVFLGGLYFAVMWAALVRFWLSLPLPRVGNALRVVARHIEQRAVEWRAARS